MNIFISSSSLKFFAIFLKTREQKKSRTAKNLQSTKTRDPSYKSYKTFFCENETDISATDA
jgi:hypothetical protein